MDHLQEKHIKALIALCIVEGHSGDDQFVALLPVLQDYSILHKLGATIGDNASINDTLCCAIEKYLLDEEGLKWDIKQ